MDIFILIISILISGGALLILIYKRRRKFSEKDLFFFREKWNNILSLKKTNPKQAILDADNLLDFALEKKGYKGTLGEKLKKSSKFLGNSQEIWNAHKLRNRIVHELDIKISFEEIDGALFVFSRVFENLGLK